MDSAQLKQLLQVFCIFLSAVFGLFSSAGAKPTISFSIPESLQGLPTFTSLTQQLIENHSARQMKTYSGKRVSNDSLIMIYYHDSTIAVTELGPQKLLLGCELIEIYNDNEGQKLLQNLSKLNKPLNIKLQEMFKLMAQCEKVDQIAYSKVQNDKESSIETTASTTTPNNLATNLAANIFPRSPFSLLSGIIPGTKWCGTGDIAETYSDLGTEAEMDRCCRQHDLCPVKIRGLQHKYDLMNDAIYTKSHCECDDIFFACLKQVNTSASQLLGSIYFNLVQVPCLHRDDEDDDDKDDSGEYEFREAKGF